MALSVVGLVLGLGWLLLIAALPSQPDPTTGETDSPVFLLVAGAFVVLRSVAELARWWSLTYVVGERSLVIDHGVLARHRRELPFDRVQQVDLQRPLVAQLLGVAAVRIDSAGEAGTTNVDLRFLELAVADALRAHILRRRDEMTRAAAAASPLAPSAAWPSGPGAPTPPGAAGSGPVYGRPLVPVETRLLSLSAGQLLVAGCTEGVVVIGLGVLAAFVVWVFGAMATGSEALGGIATAGSVVALLWLGFTVVGAIGTVIRYSGFSLTAHGDDLVLRYGLFDVRSLTIPRRRIQHVTVVDNPLRRWLGFTTVHLHSAAAPGAMAQGARGQQVTLFLLPVVPRAELDPILGAVGGAAAWSVPELVPRSPRARARAIRRRVLLLAVCLAVPAVLTWPGGAALAVVVALGVPWGLLAHARAGHGVAGEVMALAHGVVRHRIELVPIARVQSARTSSSPFQRRASLATFHLDVAGSGLVALGQLPHLYDMDAGVAAEALAEIPRRSAPHRAAPPPPHAPPLG